MVEEKTKACAATVLRASEGLVTSVDMQNSFTLAHGLYYQVDASFDEVCMVPRRTGR